MRIQDTGEHNTIKDAINILKNKYKKTLTQITLGVDFDETLNARPRHSPLDVGRDQGTNDGKGEETIGRYLDACVLRLSHSTSIHPCGVDDECHWKKTKTFVEHRAMDPDL